MTGFDPTRMNDRELFSHLVLGDLPRPGWPGRRRLIALRLLHAATALLFLVLVVLVISAGITLVFAAQDALPA